MDWHHINRTVFLELGGGRTGGGNIGCELKDNIIMKITSMYRKVGGHIGQRVDINGKNTDQIYIPLIKFIYVQRTSDFTLT